MSLNDKLLKLIDLPDPEFYQFSDARAQEFMNEIAAFNQGADPETEPTVDMNAEYPASEKVLAVSSPNKIDRAKHSSFPVLVAAVQNGQRAWEVRPKQNSHLLVKNLRTGACQSFAPYVSGKRMAPPKPSRAGARPVGIKAMLGTGDVSLHYLNERTEITQSAGEYAITMIQYDWVSNTTVTEVVDQTTPANADDPHVPSPFLRTTVKNGDTPALGPQKVGIAAARTAPGSGAALHVALTIALPRSATLVVSDTQTSTTDEQPKAIVPITLALVKLDAARPGLVTANVPIYGKQAPKFGSEVDVFFSFHLEEAISGMRFEGDFLVYVLVAGRVMNPIEIRLG